MPFPSLAHRTFRQELMDQPGINPVEHIRALDGLHRLNAISRTCQHLWREVKCHMDVRAGERLRLLDIASGGGDVAFGLWKLARRAAVDIEILGLDVSATACSRAAIKCRPAGKSISFASMDVLSADLPGGFDVVISTLFLHHLTSPDATKLLSKMAAAGRLLIVSDLNRSRIGYAAAYAACHLLTRSKTVHHDGPQSVANAFTIPEMKALCQSAGLDHAIVRRAWPWRLHRGP
jgi:2-polyprenyl-3-methyl-5-hydroxy-6-metoxy-1,4-benzoquinol methylase